MRREVGGQENGNGPVPGRTTLTLAGADETERTEQSRQHKGIRLQDMHKSTDPTFANDAVPSPQRQ